jgi:hypothetical protein
MPVFGLLALLSGLTPLFYRTISNATSKATVCHPGKRESKAMRRQNPRITDRVRLRMVHLRRFCLVGAIGVCVLAVSACASTGDAATDPTAKVVILDEPIRLVPNINTGEVGWCVTDPHGYSCPYGFVRTPVIIASWSRSSPPPVSEGYAVTTSQVVTVSIAGRRVPTRSESVLPRGLRIVTVEVRGTPGRSRSDSRSAAGRLRFTPLNADGEAITELLTSPEPFNLPVEAVADPEHPGNVACEIEVAAPLAGLVAEAASVVREVKPFKSAISSTLAACANTQYRLNGRRVVAAVMISASDPGARPAYLPGMHPIKGHAGVFQTPGIEGQMVGRRISGAWLFVSGGGVLLQRLNLLEHIRAKFELP